MAFRENASDRLARRGHEVHHQQVSGNARIHNGDNNYGLNYEGVNTTLQNLLPRADGAQINSPLREHEPSCLLGTRLEVLQEIKTWAEDGSDRRCVFWLSGMAGTGKSSMARTVAREHLTQNQQGASLFFSRCGGDVCNARKFFPIIAFQLTQRSPALRPGILEAASENLDIGTLQEQWKLLILGLLALLRPELPQQPLLIVIDALDECGAEQDVRLILQLHASANTHIPNIQLRVLMTSRPDTPIRLSFSENPGIWHRDLMLNAVPRAVIDSDIAIYLSKELKDIIRLQDAHTVRRLVEKAGGLFIWAATACRFIKSGQHYAIFAHGRLSHILEGKRGGENPEEKLDQIYAKILLTSVGGDHKDAEKKVLFDLFRRVVGSIAILFDPLSVVALGALQGFSAQFNQTTIEQLLSHLHSVLDVPADRAHLILLLHPSFRDFLLADERCSEPQVRVD